MNLPICITWVSKITFHFYPFCNSDISPVFSGITWNYVTIEGTLVSSSKFLAPSQPCSRCLWRFYVAWYLFGVVLHLRDDCFMFHWDTKVCIKLRLSGIFLSLNAVFQICWLLKLFRPIFVFHQQCHKATADCNNISHPGPLLLNWFNLNLSMAK